MTELPVLDRFRPSRLDDGADNRPLSWHGYGHSSPTGTRTDTGAPVPESVSSSRTKTKVHSKQSPYERIDENPGAWEWCKMIVLGVTLAPLRVICIVLTIVVYYIVARGYICCFRNTRPLSVLTRYAGRLVLFFCGFHWIQVFGDPNMDRDQDRNRKTESESETEKETYAHVIVCNHISFWEILYFMSAPCCPSFVFKEGCLDVPVVGKVAHKVLNGIHVDNKNKNGGKGGTQAIIDRIEEMKMEENKTEGDAKKHRQQRHRPLLIFPEGTTSNGSCLLKFRTGGFVAGTAVRPVVIQYPFRHFSPAYESIYTPVLIFRTLTQFHNAMQVKYLDVYKPTETERQDPVLFSDGVRRRMAIAMDVPLCDVGYTDKMKYHSILAKRLKAHPLGWVSNFLYVRPNPLPKEDEIGSFVYHGILNLTEEAKE